MIKFTSQNNHNRFFKLGLVLVGLLTLSQSNLAYARYNVNYNYNDNYTKIIDPAAERANQIKLLEIKQKQYSNELTNKILLDYFAGCPLNEILMGKSGLVTANNLKFIDLSTLKSSIKEFNQDNKLNTKLSDQACLDLYDKRQLVKQKNIKQQQLNQLKAPYLAFRLGYNYNTNLDYNYGFSVTNLELGFRLDNDFNLNANPLYINFGLDVLVHKEFSSFNFELGLRKDFGLIGTRHPFLQTSLTAGAYSYGKYDSSVGAVMSVGYDFNVFEIALQYNPKLIFSSENNKKVRTFSNGVGIYIGFIGNF